VRVDIQISPDHERQRRKCLEGYAPSAPKFLRAEVVELDASPG